VTNPGAGLSVFVCLATPLTCSQFPGEVRVGILDFLRMYVSIW
jgi:hypothetical protein